jgi:hypothetical protein
MPPPVPPGAGPTGGSGAGWADRTWFTVCWTVCCTVVEIVSATLVDVDWMDWITSPSSPGLRMRIEIAVLHVEQDVDDVVGQSQFQFQVQAVAPAGGARGPEGLSAQFHDQFQIQVVGGATVWLLEMSPPGEAASVAPLW